MRQVAYSLTDWKSLSNFAQAMRSRRVLNIIYLLTIYVMVQLCWWGFQITQLTAELAPHGDEFNRSVWMILGEGSVFLIILSLGVWQLRKSIRKEQHLLDKERNLILSVSHELKTPIAASRLCLETLEMRQLNPDQVAEVISTAKSANNRLESLVEQILKTALIESGDWESTGEQSDVYALTQEIVDHQICKQKIDFSGSSCTLAISRMDWETILDNLLQNAIKYSPEDSVISVEVSVKNGLLTLTCVDQGYGIPDEEKLHVFDKFYRIGNELTRTSKGTGLGLYLVRKTVELNNGIIKLTDNTPQGCVFTISFKQQ